MNTNSSFALLPLPLQIAQLEAELAQQPTHLGLLGQLLQCYCRAQRLDRAQAIVEHAAQQQAKQAAFQNDLGQLLARSGLHAAAERQFARAIAADGSYVAARLNLAQYLQVRGQMQASAPHCDAALAQEPDNRLALQLRIRAALSLRDYPRAEKLCLHLCDLAPDDAENLLSLAWVLRVQRRLAEGEAVLRRLLSFAPDNERGLFGLADNLLLSGRFDAGMAIYGQAIAAIPRPEAAKMRAFLAALPAWQPGQALAGRRIVVWNVQGQGDAIQFARYLPALLAQGVSAVGVLCQAPLIPLLGQIDARITAVHTVEEAQQQGFAAFDLYCQIEDLPMLCAPADTAPLQNVPYLSVPAERLEAWAKRVPATPDKLRVGLAWAGNPKTEFSAWRDVPLGLLAPLFAVPNAKFFNLQHGEARAQIGKTAAPLQDLMTSVQDFVDTAALISQLDLVIAADTAVVHLAGALGKPVWLLNRYESEWRWQLDRQDSPWYPTLRIFNQKKPGDWKPLIREVSEALAKLPA